MFTVSMTYHKIFRAAIIFLLTARLSTTAVLEDKVDQVPGYPPNYNTSVYSGFLGSADPKTRSLHYVFVESAQGNANKDPLILWLNGGPGCSSMIGFLQQIGPYILEDGLPYKEGDLLTKNPFSWYFQANLLFIESPAVVGYSNNNDESGHYLYTDENTAIDNLHALIQFFTKYPQLRGNQFWLAGESYAGKYIPDLAVLIDLHNREELAASINLKGLLINNGVMYFQNSAHHRSAAEFMMGHQLVDPEIRQYWINACSVDPQSAGCQFFYKKYNQNVMNVNLYGVYASCHYPQNQQEEDNGVPCYTNQGIMTYFNAVPNKLSFHIPGERLWRGPCVGDINYSVTMAGSMDSYRYLLTKLQPTQPAKYKYNMLLYNGDWDRVVPYVDTLKNLKQLGLQSTSPYQPWFVSNQHAGFITRFGSGLVFATVKGANHQVTQTKRAEAYHLLTLSLNGQLFK